MWDNFALPGFAFRKTPVKKLLAAAAALAASLLLSACGGGGDDGGSGSNSTVACSLVSSVASAFPQPQKRRAGRLDIVGFMVTVSPK